MATLTIMDPLPCLTVSKLYPSMSFDFSLLFYADAVWLDNCVEFICTSFVSLFCLCKVFAFFNLRCHTNGSNCLPLQVLYVQSSSSATVSDMPRCVPQAHFSAQSGSEMSYGNQGVVLILCSHLSYFNTVCLARDRCHND